MTNNPHLQFKPDLLINEKVYLYLTAGDWNTFMAWAMTVDTTGVGFIISQIADQVADVLYTKESMKAADAAFEQKREDELQNHPVAQMFRMAQGQAVGPRCVLCERVPGMPTAPCPACPDYEG